MAKSTEQNQDDQDIFKMRSFITWAARKPGEYTYVDNFNCALGQYLTSKGMKNVCIASHTFFIGDDTYIMNKALARELVSEHTFKRLASNLKRLKLDEDTNIYEGKP